jgi:hypothetical protein
MDEYPSQVYADGAIPSTMKKADRPVGFLA